MTLIERSFRERIVLVGVVSFPRTESEVDASLARRVRSGGRSLARHCFGAGAKGAGGGTFLLIKASSFCLSVAEPFAPAVESVFFGGAGAGVAIG